eukprot:scpid81597/ scgid0785/ Transcription factor SOX-13; SRY (Sex determining region Y)-box 13
MMRGNAAVDETVLTCTVPAPGSQAAAAAEVDNGNSRQPLADSESQLVDDTEPDKSLSATGGGKSSNRIKRPMNAFMLFALEERKVIARNHPNMHNSEISKQLGKKWKSKTHEEQAPYREAAGEIRREHQKKHPDYQFKPTPLSFPSHSGQS